MVTILVKTSNIGIITNIVLITILLKIFLNAIKTDQCNKCLMMVEANKMKPNLYPW